MGTRVDEDFGRRDTVGYCGVVKKETKKIGYAEVN